MLVKKNLSKILATATFFLLFFLFFSNYMQFLRHKTTKKFFNIVLIGAAGSGKGTQSEFLKEKYNLLQISAGDVLREYRKNPNAKYTKKINQFIENGQLVPVKIVNTLIKEHVEQNVFCKKCNYNGVIFDGYPRSIEQLKFLDKFLKKNNNQIDTAIYINVPIEKLVDRLTGRFACSKCGELYHKITKPTKIQGVCDKCGNKTFVTRGDDANADAIKKRFEIFQNTTNLVLDEYNKKNIVIEVNGNQKPTEVFEEINKKITEKGLIKSL